MSDYFNIPDFINKNTEWDKTVMMRRGMVLHFMVIIEEMAEEVIKTYFFGKDKKLKDDFDHMLLSKEFFSLFAKLTLVGSIAKLYAPKFHEKNDKFLSQCQELIDYRNACAHRSFHSEKFKSDEEFILEYKGMDRGKKKIKDFAISDKESKVIIDKAKHIHQILFNLMDEIVQLKKPQKHK